MLGALSVRSMVSLANLLVVGIVDGAMTAAKDLRNVIVYHLVARLVPLIMLSEAQRHGWGTRLYY